MIRRGKHAAPRARGRETRLVGRAVPLALAFVLVLGAVAWADNVVNDVVLGGNDTIQLPATQTTVNYWIVATAGDSGDSPPSDTCNPAREAVTVTINTPTEVSATLNSLTFTACGEANKQAVVFTSSTPGEYLITVSTSPSAGYNTTPGGFTLHVLEEENGVLCEFGDVRPPINADGSSVWKAGRGVVPAKFQLWCMGGDFGETMILIDSEALAQLVRDTFGSDPVLTLRKLTSNSGCDPCTEEETQTGQANSGSYFRFDDGDDQYIYNINIKNRTAGSYEIMISLDGGPSKTVNFSLN